MNTNVQNIRELDKQYHPSVRGIINPVEMVMIERILELKDMSEIELRNLRDFVVMFYSKVMDKEDTGKMIEQMDKMSAITFVIDSKLVDIGCEV